MSKIRILITGSTGFIGSYLLEKLKKSGRYEIFCLTRKPKQGKKFNYIVSDISDSNSLKSLPDVDVLIHLAAIKQHYFQKKDIIKVNVDGTKNILENIKFRQIIFSSTILAANPSDVYGRSKKTSEELIKKSGVNYTILRFSPVFGRGDDTDVTKIIKIAKKYPVVPVIGDGKRLMQPIFIDDCVKIIESCILNPKTYKKTYFAVGETISFNNLIENAEKAFGVSRVKLHVPLWLTRWMVEIYNSISSKPFITEEQLKNYEKEIIFDSEDIRKDLNFKPSPLVKSIKNSV